MLNAASMRPAPCGTTLFEMKLAGSIWGIFKMTGPRPAGRRWTRAEEAELRQLIASKVKPVQIAKKLKRSTGAIYARMNAFKKLPRALPFRAQSRSLPLERLAAYGMVEIGEVKKSN
jgi:hypothetical protein